MAELTTPESTAVSNATNTSDVTKVYDLYASLLNYKKKIYDVDRIGVSISWVPKEHQRRLLAYELLKAYFSNYSRDFRHPPETGDDSLNDNLSEVGDPAWYANKMRDKLLGGKVSITAPLPTELGVESVLVSLIGTDDIEPALKKATEEQLKELQKMKPILAAREAKLQGWFKDGSVYNTLSENELKCSWSGDMVYYTMWDDIKKKPVLHTYDPGYIFPYFFNESPTVSFQDNNSEVVERWFLAWNTTFYDTPAVYRETYELRRGFDPEDTRPEGQKEYKTRCFRHIAYYAFNEDAGIALDEFTDEQIVPAKNEDGSDGLVEDWTDMEIDFIPFKWIPNIALEGEAFGLSNLQPLIDIFDNMINNYSDTNKNSEYLGGAIMAASGEDVKPATNLDGSLKAIEIQPCSVYFLGKGGQISVVDTSTMQTALIATREVLHKSFLNNADIPDVLTAKGGDTTANLSGYALRIMIQPFLDKITPMRSNRSESYGELFIMIQKLWALKGNDYERLIFAGEIYKPEVNFGDLSPSDELETVKKLNLLDSILSNKTILELAKKEGYDIDVVEELIAKEEQADKEAERNKSLFDDNRLNGTEGDE